MNGDKELPSLPAGAESREASRGPAESTPQGIVAVGHGADTSAAGAAHPYRSQPRRIDEVAADLALLQAFGKDTRKDQLLRELQAALDAGAIEGLSRKELASVALVLRGYRDDIRRRCTPIHDNASWVSAAFFGVSVVVAILQYQQGVRLLVVALLFMVAVRLLVTITKRWLGIADVLEKIANEIGGLAQKLPAVEASLGALMKPLHQLPEALDKDLQHDGLGGNVAIQEKIAGNADPGAPTSPKVPNPSTQQGTSGAKAKRRRKKR